VKNNMARRGRCFLLMAAFIVIEVGCEVKGPGL